jgi:HEAT repeat protein
MRLLLPFLLLWSAAPRDLDVGVAPGTPLEWTKELRVPTPTGHRGSVPTGGGSDILDGSTTALGVDFGSTSPLGVGRITTRDLPGHLPWTVPKATEEDDRVPTPGGAVTWEYPPAVTATQWWWVLAPLLRGGLHAQLVSEAEIGVLLVEIGEPARGAADAASGYGFCADAVAMVKREVTPVPSRRPEPPVMETPLQQMFANLAAMELTSDYPYGMNPYFAQRTLSLGERAFPAVLACAKSEHSFLRRNAISVLAHYGRPEGAALLREIAAGSKDAVARTRAILALARRRDREIVPLLVKMLDDTDRFKRALAAHALGLAGQGSGGEALLKKAAANVNDGELLFSILPSLARIRMGDGKFTAELRKLAATVARGTYDVGIGQAGDQPDPKHTRRDILLEFLDLAIAAQGDEPSIKRVLARKGWRPAAQYLAIEVLSGLGEAGTKALLEIVSDAAIEPALRAQALVRVLMPVPDVKLAARIAANEALPPGVRGIAISVLPGFDPPAARAAARSITDAYRQEKYRAPAEAYLVLTAVQALGKAGDGDVDLLLEVAAIAVEQRRKATAKAKQPKSPYQQEVEIVIEVPLLETVLIELGRTKSKRAGEALAMILADGTSAGRAEAALGLGAIGGNRAMRALVAGLEDKDGWVRWACYAGLHALTGKEFFCDWIDDRGRGRDEAVRKWKEFVSP